MTAWPSIVIALAALGFTLASFWWLNVRRGRIIATEPHTFALAALPNLFRLRVPIALYNTGARAIVIRDLRVWAPDTQQVLALPWVTTRATVRPDEDDVEDFPRPFPVRGREALTVIAEFMAPFPGFTLPGGPQRMRVESLEDRDSKWRQLVEFVLHVPESDDLRSRYLAHSNVVKDPETERRAAEAAQLMLDRLKAVFPPAEMSGEGDATAE